jgi:V/A-type H+-transporting ATPase subunit E
LFGVVYFVIFATLFKIRTILKEYMQDKLQELTDRLYNEGLSKGKQDGEELLQKAHAEAESILAQAKAEAEKIIAQANKEAEDLKTRVAADVKMAATQSIAVTKQEMEKMIVTKAAGAGVKNAMSNTEFVKELVKEVVKAFNPQNASPVSLDLILPESLKAQIGPFVQNEIAQQFKGGVNVEYSKKMNGGFKVAPKEGGYMLQFTEEEFTQLIANYLRPATKKILFG